MQFIALLDTVKGSFDEIPILLAGWLGLRRGEIFGLRWSDVDFDKRTLAIEQTSVRFTKEHIKSPKSDSSRRTLMLPPYICKILLRYRTNEKVLTTTICGRYKPQSYSERFSRLLEQQGLEHLRFHDLRHYNATIMLKYGIPDKVASKRLGHSSTQVTKEIYQHVTSDMDISYADKIDEIFSKNL